MSLGLDIGKYSIKIVELSSKLCGLNRIGHFDGVCTVVYRFLNLNENFITIS